MCPRVFLAACLLAVPAAAEEELHDTRLGNSARLETSMSAGEIAANAFLLPLAFAFNQPHYGFEARPYADGPRYGRGERDWAGAARLSGQRLGGGRGAGHAELQVRGANRLGWQVAWDGWARGALRAPARGDLWSGHITANYVQSGRLFLELGLGAGSLRTDRTRLGPSAALLLEAFPGPPWFFSGKWQTAILGGQGFHQLQARAGVLVWGAGLHAGYAALIGPLGTASGPEAGLSVWF